MDPSELLPPLMTEVAAARVDLLEPEASTAQPASGTVLDPWLSGDSSQVEQDVSQPSPVTGHLSSLEYDNELLGRRYSASDQQGMGGLLSNLMSSNANSWASPANSAPQLYGDPNTNAPGQEAAGNVAGGREDSPGRDDSRSQSQGPEDSSPDVPEGDESDEEQSGATARRRKRRRNILPRIARGQRCGECHTCRNPQMKKACLTMRAKLMQEMEKAGDLPLTLLTSKPGPLPPRAAAANGSASVRRGADFSALDGDSRHTSASQRPAQRQQTEQEDPFTREMRAIVTRTGGIEHKSMPNLVRLVQKEVGFARRMVLCTVIKSSAPVVLKAIVRSPVLAEVQKWLVAAAGAGASQIKLAERCLEVFDVLPIDVNALQSSGIGKTLGKMRKSEPKALQAPAAKLVAKWKKAVEQAKEAPDDGGKRAREGPDVESIPEAKKPKQESAAAAGKANLPRQSSVDSKGDPRAPDEGKAKAMPMEVDDNALFQKKTKAAASVRESVIQARKVHQLKLLDGDAAKKLALDRKDTVQKAAEKPAEQPGEKANAPSIEGMATDAGKPDSMKNDPRHAGRTAEPSVKGVDEQAARRTGTRPPVSAFASAPLSTPLGSSRVTALGGSVTRIGGLSSSPSLSAWMPREAPLDAAGRAAAAAAAVPDPPEMPKKEKNKKVSWNAPEALVQVRWFKQDDEVVAVRKDAKDTVELPGPTTAEQQPPGFTSAAKREHQNEAAVMRQNRDKVMEAQEELEELQPANVITPAKSAAFPPQTAWPTQMRGPPFNAAPDPAWNVVLGTETEESAMHAQRTVGVPECWYRDLVSIPASPLEAPYEDVSRLPAPVRIPLGRMDAQQILMEQLEALAAELAKLPLIGQPQQPPSQQPPPQQQPPPAQQIPQPQIQQPQFVQQPVVLPAPPQQPQPQQSAGFAEAPGFAQPGPALPPPPFQQITQPQSLPRPGTLPPPGPLPPAPPLRHPAAPATAGKTPGRGRGRELVRGRGPQSRGRGRGDAPVPARLVPCRWFNSPKGCRNGDNCRFSHDPSLAAQGGQQRSSFDNGPPAHSEASGGGRRPSFLYRPGKDADTVPPAEPAPDRPLRERDASWG